VAWAVWEGVEDYEVALAPVEDEVRLIVVFCRFLTQDAIAFLRPPYVFYSPWRPKLLHLSYFMSCRVWADCLRVYSK